MGDYKSMFSGQLSSAEYFRTSLQDFVDSDFDEAPTEATDVLEEVQFGALEWGKIDVRVNSLIDVKTGQRVNDDYKKLIFRDLTYQPKLGTRYKFNENIWIVFSTNNIKSLTSSVYIRRCNEVLALLDKYQNIHYEPCVVDYNVIGASPDIRKSMETPRARTRTFCQLNDYTKDVDVSDRFLFGRQAYRVVEWDTFNRTETMNSNSVSLLSFFVEYDNKDSADDFSTGVANNQRTINYKIDILGESITEAVGYETDLVAEVRCNDSIVQENVNWYCSNINVATIDKITGHLKLLTEGTAQIVAKLSGNEVFTGSMTINVSLNPVMINQDLITPDITYLQLRKEQQYEVFEYVNNVKQVTSFTITAEAVPKLPKKSYILNVVDGNTFKVTNLEQTDIGLLKINCTNNSTGNVVSILIELGGMW